MMTRLACISACLALLLHSAGAAQSDTSQQDINERRDRYPLSLGMAWGMAAPLRNRGAESDDPLHILDSSGTYGSFAFTAAWRITERVTVEGVIDHMPIAADTILAEQAATTYPDQFILTHTMLPFSTSVAGLGLSYGFPLYRGLSFEPGLLAGSLSVAPIRWRVLLKEPGTNVYRRIERTVEGRNSFTLIPTLMLRYVFDDGESRWGLQLRSAYYYGRMNLLHSSTENRLTEEPVTETERRYHRFDCLNIGLGVYYRAF